MTITVEDGTGISGANSYQSAASITSYCTLMGYTAWDSYSTTLRESAILRAMKFIDSHNFKGTKTNKDYPLRWPRASVYDRDGMLLWTDEIPRQLKDALAEASYREAVNPRSLQSDLKRGDKVKRKKIDVLEWEYFASAPVGTVVTIIEDLLIGLVQGSSIEVIRT